jgi:hypothetical protein
VGINYDAPRCEAFSVRCSSHSPQHTPKDETVKRTWSDEHRLLCLSTCTASLKISIYCLFWKIVILHWSCNAALDGGEWSASRPGHALPPGIGPPVPIVHKAGWAPEPVWTERLEEKSFRLCRGSSLDRQVVQPVARHYTDGATRLTKQLITGPYGNK